MSERTFDPSKPMQVTFSGTWETDYRTLDYEVTGTCTPYRPGRVNGPPEKCYPEEPASFQDWDVKLTGYSAPNAPEVSIANLTDYQRGCLTGNLRRYLQANEAELTEQAFEVANEIVLAAQERDYP